MALGVRRSNGAVWLFRFRDLYEIYLRDLCNLDLSRAHGSRSRRPSPRVTHRQLASLPRTAGGLRPTSTRPSARPVRNGLICGCVRQSPFANAWRCFHRLRATSEAVRRDESLSFSSDRPQTAAQQLAAMVKAVCVAEHLDRCFVWFYHRSALVSHIIQHYSHTPPYIT